MTIPIDFLLTSSTLQVGLAFEREVMGEQRSVLCQRVINIAENLVEYLAFAKISYREYFVYVGLGLGTIHPDALTIALSGVQVRLKGNVFFTDLGIDEAERVTGLFCALLCQDIVRNSLGIGAFSGVQAFVSLLAICLESLGHEILMPHVTAGI